MKYTTPLKKCAAWLLAFAALLAFGSTAARAEAKYPHEPIRVVVPFGPGGLADISMRIVAKKLSERLGQQVIVENRPGAGGVVAANTVLAAPHDGYTLMFFVNGTAIAKTLFKLPFDPVTDFIPISTVAYFDLVLVTRGDGPLHTIADVKAAALKKPLLLGTINPGSTQNLSAELFKSRAGIAATIIPYKSTPEVIVGLVRGDVDVGFESYAALKGPITSGQLRAIAVTGRQRAPWLPKVPTVRESGVPDYDVTGWNALFAPANTPPAVVQLLNREVNAVMKMPDVKNKLLALGTLAKGSTSAELGAIFRSDIAKWAAVIKQAGIKTQ